MIPSSIAADNQTRSDARLAYFNGFIDRPNFHVISGMIATKVIVESSSLGTRDLPDGLFISGVQVSCSHNTWTHTYSYRLHLP